MGIKDWLWKNSNEATYREVSCRELFEAAEELQIRKLAFDTCVNMIANAIGQCEFRTFEEHKETKGIPYYIWNIEPNFNQNSSEFIHKLVTNLYTKNEALMISQKRNGEEQLIVADEWDRPDDIPTKPRVYKNVRAGDVAFSTAFKEQDVLFFRLNANHMKPLVDGFYSCYYKIINAAMTDYRWRKGKHWKVHISSTAKADQEFETVFAAMMTQQIKPFLQSDGAVLPEFDGYLYEEVGQDKNTSRSTGETRDLRNLINDIFDITAKAFNIPPVLINGDIANSEDAMNRWLTLCIDPLCENIQEEIIRKRYGFAGWRKGDYLKIDTSTLQHFDMFANAANIEKLVGSGVYSINDILRAIGQPEILEAWANEHYLTLNMANIASAGVPLKGGENE